MGFKQNELSYLKQIKKSNGLSQEQIVEDIRNLNNSQIKFKNINNKVNLLFKIIKMKDKRIIDLEIKLKKLQNKKFIDDFEELK